MDVTTWTKFARWIELNHISQGAERLWYRLYSRLNVFGWPEWVSVGNAQLMGLLSISENTLKKKRDELVSKKLLEYKPGKKGQYGKYKLLEIPEIKYTSIIEVQTEVQAEVQAEVHSEDIIRHRQRVDDDDDHLLRKRKEKKVIEEIKRLYLGLLGEYTTPSQISKILVFYRYGLSLEVIASAFDRGSLYADRSKFAYILGCLERWHSAGIKTIDELTDDDYRFDVATGRLE